MLNEMIEIKRNIGVYVLFFCLIGSTINAQQDAQFTQYMYNTMCINPAYAGSRNMTSVLALYRTQWIGLDGAPKTFNLNLDAPIGDGLGLGLSVINDNIGPSDENNFNVDVSYKLNISDDYRLFFGLKASVGLLNVDFTKLKYYDPADPQFQNNIDNKFSPNIGAGLYLQSDKAYLGVSVPYMLETLHYDHSQVSAAKEKMHFYFIAGYVFDLSDDLKFKPALLAKGLLGAPIQVDLSANFLFIDKFTAGVAYRFDAAFSGMAGFQVSEGLLLGYAYDADVTKLGKYNSGSHEIFLRFDISDYNNYKKVSPRFF
jgi:type IX secretion system PorP/SprF family membrane protein